MTVSVIESGGTLLVEIVMLILDAGFLTRDWIGESSISEEWMEDCN